MVCCDVLAMPLVADRAVPSTEDAAQASVSAGKASGVVFSRLPVQLFTLLASLCRWEPFRQDVCMSGLLQACVDRFVLETSDPNTDIKVWPSEYLLYSCCAFTHRLVRLPICGRIMMQVQAELAVLFARIAGRCYPGFGSVNDTLLGKQRTCSPDALAR